MIDFYIKEKMSEIREKMYANPESIMKLSTVADEIGYSKEGFRYAWFRIFGENYIDDQDKARAAYIEHGLSIRKSMKKIAKELGLTDITCVRIYTRVYGHEPNEKGNVNNGKET